MRAASWPRLPPLTSRVEAFKAPVTVVLAAPCFAVTGHRLVQFAREFAAEEQRTQADKSIA
jgi:hypothetical protein